MDPAVSGCQTETASHRSAPSPADCASSFPFPAHLHSFLNLCPTSGVLVDAWHTGSWLACENTAHFRFPNSRPTGLGPYVKTLSMAILQPPNNPVSILSMALIMWPMIWSLQHKNRSTTGTIMYRIVCENVVHTLHSTSQVPRTKPTFSCCECHIELTYKLN